VRRRHLIYYQRATRWLTPFFQGDSRVLGWLRDVGFPLACRIPPFRRLMSASMAGVAAGFLGRREPLVHEWP
jgi:2-polyprenyl-6-methoxyphenol hydroxylase-like FAD-dependent oxidoreductase